MFVLTGKILNELCSNAHTPAAAENLAKQLTEICPQYGINTADIFHEFIATLIHESGNMVKMVEGLNYQAIALTKSFYKWGRISLDDCYRYGRTAKQKANQQMIANIIYGGAWGLKHLGNNKDGDGWLFRGGGFIQSTGRRMAQKFTDFINAKKGTKYTAEQISELIKTDIQLSIHSSCWVFCVEKKLIDEAIDDDVVRIREMVNGGRLGLDKVIALTKKAEQLIVEKI